MKKKSHQSVVIIAMRLFLNIYQTLHSANSSKVCPNALMSATFSESPNKKEALEYLYIRISIYHIPHGFSNIPLHIS